MRRPLTKRIYDAVIVVVVHALAIFLRLLPTGVALRFGEQLGNLLFRALRARRRVAQANLSRAFPALPPDARDAIMREHFRHLGMNVVELLLFPQWRQRFPQRIEILGREALDEAIKAGAGIVVFIPHTGNWEILAPLWPSLHPRPIVLFQRLPNEALDRLVSDCRRVNGIDLVPRTGGLRAVVAGLRAGSPVGFLADQDAGPAGMFVPFFGESASAEPSPVVLARRLRCRMLLCLTFRTPDRGHQVVFETIPPVPAASPEAEDAATLRHIYARLEAYIREHPAQWLWIHRRWKTRPTEPES